MGVGGGEKLISPSLILSKILFKNLFVKCNKFLFYNLIRALATKPYRAFTSQIGELRSKIKIIDDVTL